MAVAEEQRVNSRRDVRNSHVLLLSSSTDGQYVECEDLTENGDGLYKTNSAISLPRMSFEYRKEGIGSNI